MTNKDISATKRALIALQEMQAKLASFEQKQHEPIAVIGISCRFPGNSGTPEDFWEMLCDGRDAIEKVPPERWDADEWFDENPETSGKMYTKHGGFLHGIDGFDPQFFGISPREATFIDPHQRILLELAWEAFENANLAPDRFYNSRTGVYVGISNFEYGANLFWSDDTDRIVTYTGTGGSLGVTAGRISYTLGLTGPSLIVDTACSSSLVTTHLACQALRLQECDLALSAGVNLFFGPETHINFCKAKMLAPDGRCKTFDASADGYARGEGAGVVILKRLSDAIHDGDKIWALIRGSSVNQDGPSGGLTVPNGPSQRRVMVQALAAAQIKPEQVGYVEAHGTGTALGDPIEVRALGEVYGKSRNTNESLWLGSVKTNFGHLESAAGIAGLIKTILIVHHGTIPPHLHFKNPTPHIPWDELPIKIPTSLQDWNKQERIAGLSSFSFSGTNAHIILSNFEQRDLHQDARVSPSDKTTLNLPETSEINLQLSKESYSCYWGLLPISAKNESALDALLERYRDSAKVWDKDGILWRDICLTAALGRSQLPYRGAIIVNNVKELLNETSENPQKRFRLIKGRAKSSSEKIIFLFTGQGSQYQGMGQTLYRESKVFREAIEECDAILSPILQISANTLKLPPKMQSNSDLNQNSAVLFSQSLQPQHEHKVSIVDLLYGKEPATAEQLEQTALTQPLLFSIEYALAMLWKSWGIKPDAVIGHSVGEYVAACIAGVFSLEDGLKLIAKRGLLMVQLCQSGSMLSISMAESEVIKEINEFSLKYQNLEQKYLGQEHLKQEHLKQEHYYNSDQSLMLSIATVNSPESVVVSGSHKAVELFSKELEAKGVETKKLRVSHAFHSPLMDPMLAKFKEIAQTINYSTPKIPIITNISGKIAGLEIASADYWVRHVKAPVRFADGMKSLLLDGYRTFVEIGAKPTLSALGASVAEAMDLSNNKSVSSNCKWLPTLRYGHNEWQIIFESLGHLWVNGADVNWHGVINGTYSQNKNHIRLPNYPFQRRSYMIDWLGKKGRAEQTETAKYQAKYHINGSDSSSNKPNIRSSLLGQEVLSPALPSNTKIFSSKFDPIAMSLLVHHRIFGTVVMPAAAHAELALEAGAKLMAISRNSEKISSVNGEGNLKNGESNIFLSDVPILKNISIHQALVLNEKGETEVQIIINDNIYKIYSRYGEHWILNSSGEFDYNKSQSLSSRSFSSSGSFGEYNSADIEHHINRIGKTDITSIMAKCPNEIPVAEYYRKTHEAGIEHGEQFQAMTGLWQGEGITLSRLQLPEQQVTVTKGDFKFHPVLLDAAFQTGGVSMLGQEELYLPVGIDSLCQYKKVPSDLWCVVYARGESNQGQIITSDLDLTDDRGDLIAKINGLHFQRANKNALIEHLKKHLHLMHNIQNNLDNELIGHGEFKYHDWLYQLRWIKKNLWSSDAFWLSNPKSIAEKLIPDMQEKLPEILFYQDFLPILNRLAVLYAKSAISQVNIGDVIPEHKRLLNRLIELSATQSGNISYQNSTNMLSRQDNVDEIEKIVGKLEKRFPNTEAELALVTRCGKGLANALNGSVDGLQLLFPDGDWSAATRLYTDSPNARAINSLLNQAILQATEQLPSGDEVRIIEVGAGTGGTTAHLLPYLPVEQTKYVFTDITPMFLGKAKERFKEYGFVDFKTLNIELEPAAQGFLDSSFDIVIATNVIHATRNISDALINVQKLLAPGGMLFMIEVTSPQPWLDITFGLTEGWWRSTDIELRNGYPLMDAKKWSDVLTSNGFDEVDHISPDRVADKAILNQSVILARKPLSDKLSYKDNLYNENNLQAKSNLKIEHCLLLSNDDNNQLEKTLSKSLQANGVKVTVRSSIGYNYETKSFENIEPNLLKDIDSIIMMTGASNYYPENLDTNSLDLAQQQGCFTLFNTVQAVAKLELSKPPAIWVVTRGAAPISECDNVSYSSNLVDASNCCLNQGIAQSPLWAMGQVVRNEYPELRCTMIDLDPEEIDTSKSAQTVINLIQQDLAQEPAAIRGDACYVPRFQRDKFKHINLENGTYKQNYKPLTVRSDAAYLITGGLGDLGLLTARWLVEKKGARKIALVGRSDPSPEALEQIAAIKSLGYKKQNYESSPDCDVKDANPDNNEPYNSDINIKIIKADVTNYDQMLFAVSEAQRDGSSNRLSIAGVIHAAGKVDDGMLSSMTWGRFADVLAPKVNGAWNLHKACSGLELDFFILYSSVASQFMSPSQSSYASANAFLDALAVYRESLNLPVMAINWGPWSEIGLAARLNTQNTKSMKILEARGIGTISPQQGIEILSYLFDHPVKHITVVNLDLKRVIETIGKIPMFEVLRKDNGCITDEPSLGSYVSAQLPKQHKLKIKNHSKSEDSSSFITLLSKMPAAEQQNTIVDTIKAHTSDILRLDSPLLVEEDIGFFDQGMDSLTAIELRNSLQTKFGQTMPTTLLFKYPTVRTLAEYIVNSVLQFEQPESEQSEQIETKKSEFEQEQSVKIKQSNHLQSDNQKVVNEVSDMSEEELAALIDGELNDLMGNI